MIFSIIVPIYNVEKYLRCCVDSVLAENFADYEMILVDDGSPDGCGKICDEYAGKYPHIKVIHQENGGLSDARNAGIRAAKGDYLIFLDSDDYWADTNRSKNAGGILFDLQQLADKKVDLILHPSSFNYRDIPKGADFSDNDFVRHFETLVEGRYYIANAWTKIVRREIIIKTICFSQKDTFTRISRTVCNWRVLSRLLPFTITLFTSTAFSAALSATTSNTKISAMC